MYYLIIVSGLGLVVSLLFNREKTYRAVKIAARRFVNILPVFLIMLILVSVVLYFIPGDIIVKYLGSENMFSNFVFAALIGSVVIMPGFIAFPLSGILLETGVPYTVLSAFTTTLMMVGILTFPVEKAYLGVKVTVIRNVISFIIALIVALITGIVFREIL
jgi:uncharacterized membrane protein YraQ (UPF0718 family)